MKDLTKSDYKTLLTYYNIPFKNLSKQQIQKKAENIIAEKLCKCIKKVEINTKNNKRNISNNNESAKIAICTDSILSKKGIKTHGFTCKKKPTLTRKNKNPALQKTKRILSLRIKNKTRKNKY